MRGESESLASSAFWHPSFKRRRGQPGQKLHKRLGRADVVASSGSPRSMQLTNAVEMMLDFNFLFFLSFFFFFFFWRAGRRLASRHTHSRASRDSCVEALQPSRAKAAREARGEFESESDFRPPRGALPLRLASHCSCSAVAGQCSAVHRLRSDGSFHLPLMAPTRLSAASRPCSASPAPLVSLSWQRCPVCPAWLTWLAHPASPGRCSLHSLPPTIISNIFVEDRHHPSRSGHSCNVPFTG